MIDKTLGVNKFFYFNLSIIHFYEKKKKKKKKKEKLHI